jgi:hypothetical protein
MMFFYISGQQALEVLGFGGNDTFDINGEVNVRVGQSRNGGEFYFHGVKSTDISVVKSDGDGIEVKYGATGSVIMSQFLKSFDNRYIFDDVEISVNGILQKYIDGLQTSGDDVINYDLYHYYGDGVSKLIIDGGIGNDAISVNTSNVFLFDIKGGKGDDSINIGSIISGFKKSIYYMVGDGNDTLTGAFFENIYLDNVDLDSISFQVIGQGLKIKYSQSDSLFITDFFNLGGTSAYKSLKINGENYDGKYWQVPSFSDQNDQLVNWNYNLVYDVDLGDGNDIFGGGHLENRVLGGKGNDTISVGGTLNYVEGGEGNDTIYAQNRGSDSRVVYRRGDGVDTIYSLASYLRSVADKSVLQFQGVKFKDVEIKRVDRNLEIVIDPDLGSQDKVIIGDALVWEIGANSRGGDMWGTYRV